MVVGLYGIGYAYAAWRLDRAFPFIIIGLAGKVFGPIGWIVSVRSGELPFRTFPLIVFDDLLWWLPFGLFLLEGTTVVRFLERTAPYWCAALHLIAAGGTLVLLRGGSETVADVQRRAFYLTEHPERWRIGWMLWMIAALSLAGFYAWWGSRTAMRPALLAFGIAALGLMCDFAGESLYVGWIPQPNTPLDRAASLLTGAAGNGLYTTAGVLLTMVTPSLPLRWMAWMAWLGGLALTTFTIAGNPIGIVAASMALMIFFIPWVVMVGIRLR
jgi:hypothetical protein